MGKTASAKMSEKEIGGPTRSAKGTGHTHQAYRMPHAKDLQGDRMKPNRPRLAQRVASLSVLAVGAVLVGDLQAQAPPVATQIAAAVQAAPAGDREGAKVLGYQDDGSIVTLREGSNHLVCLADDPGQDGWSVACYHDSLDPFMARGRALRAQGVTDAADVTETRFAEAEAGTLAMPEKPAMLYVLAGDGFDAASGEVQRPFLRWVIYSPGPLRNRRALQFALPCRVHRGSCFQEHRVHTS